MASRTGRRSAAWRSHSSRTLPTFSAAARSMAKLARSQSRKSGNTSAKRTTVSFMRSPSVTRISSERSTARARQRDRLAPPIGVAHRVHAEWHLQEWTAGPCRQAACAGSRRGARARWGCHTQTFTAAASPPVSRRQGGRDGGGYLLRPRGRTRRRRFGAGHTRGGGAQRSASPAPAPGTTAARRPDLGPAGRAQPRRRAR